MDAQSVLEFRIGSFTVEQLLWSIVLLAVCIVLVKLLMRGARRMIGKSHLDASVKLALTNTVRFLLYLIVILLVADSLGIPMTSLIALVSVAGLAVSLAIQDTLSNVFSGIILLINKPFAAGDYVQIGALEGTVMAINLMNTHLCTADHKTVYIPNKDVNSGAIVNFSREPFRRVELMVNASYDDPTEQVKAALQQAIEKTPTAVKEPAPFVGLEAYESSSIAYVVRVWTKTPDYWTTYYTLREAVRVAFQENGITMTYEHLQVHMVE
ncbi:MAG: mechanosensitive ion channel family protein [Acutalibacteraceae bacterium]